jgi:monoamine oxidase
MNIIIIGGGLSGLTTAYLLEKEGLTATILEARDRLGGRIYTSRTNGEAPIEMGATWLGKKHQNLISLLEELNIDIYEQYMGNKGYYEPMSISPPQLVDLPPNEEPSYRIAGGSDKVIQALHKQLQQSNVLLNRPVSSIQKTNRTIEVNTGSEHFNADVVISTLPPKLLVDSISFKPELPENVRNIAEETHTWMAESIKVALTYKNPFWRTSNSSGTIFSNVGPINEMYDHSIDHQSLYALKGFMNDSYYSISRTERKEIVLKQLRRFYGEKANRYLSYQETVWKHEPFSFTEYETHILPHQHNGHPVFQTSYWDNRLIISGSETATNFPGYMDGAVESAQQAVNQLIPINM